jgi:hypothetical protein
MIFAVDDQLREIEEGTTLAEFVVQCVPLLVRPHPATVRMDLSLRWQLTCGRRLE